MDDLEQAQQIMNELENKIGKKKILLKYDEHLTKTYDGIWEMKVKWTISGEIDWIPIDIETAEHVKNEMEK
ncbi:hypothetical protein [Fructilactobacillus frigidiflavus]|uniref:hypothetical protein n=1 Tax=Fructilactobacillus frigidiflavus TaxID=3242688 RepID=UPI0037571B18